MKTGRCIIYSVHLLQFWPFYSDSARCEENLSQVVDQSKHRQDEQDEVH